MGEFEERVAQLSEKKRALLELARKRAARQAAAGNGEARPQARAPIAPRPAGMERPPLSVNQEQLWFLDQLAPGQPTYNIVQGLRLRGTLDLEALRSSLDRLVARHEALRTTFASEHGEPYQVIAPPEVGATLALTDLSHLSGREAEEAMRAVIEEREVRTPFDLAAGPLFRARLITLADDDHVLTLGVHHSVADGWSVSVLNAELTELFAAAVDGREPDLPELAIQYPDYALWQREYLESEAFRQSLKFWKDRCADLPMLELPTDRPRPPVPTYRGNVITHTLGRDLVERLRDLSRRSGASLYMTLQAAYLALMVRYTGQEDIVTGTPVTGRSRPELERLVGFFVNMVVLRTDASGDPTFAELLARTREMLLTTWDHQEVPFEKVVDEVQPEREAGRNPLFQSGMQVLSATTAGGSLEFPGVSVDSLPLKSSRSRFDLAVSAIEGPDEVMFGAEYSTELFDQARIERLLRHLERILEAVAEDPSLRISELPVLSEEEERRILVDWQGPEVPYEPSTIHRLIREQVERTPEAVAVRYDGQDLTYAELDRRSDALAHHLRALGVRREELVAMALERDLDVVVALVGIMKAGAAFVPLDVGYPEARMRFILEDIETRFVLTRQEFSSAIPEGPWQLVLLDRSWPEIEAAAPASPPEDWASPDSLAYVIYTSGSTGQPKGVLIEHAHMVNHLLWWRDVPKIRQGDVLLQFSSIVFDLSEGEIFAALSQGATVLFTHKDTLPNPTAVADLMRREHVTYIGAPPAMLVLLEAEPYPDLRAMVAGGEAFGGELVNRWNVEGRMFVNGYGPTETTVGCIVNVCRGREWLSPPPIGSPMANRRAYVVDRSGNLLPVGVPGELLIGGHGVGRGYLKRPGLTADKFVPDPFSPQPGARAYRSGDLVEWTEEGELQFLGRIDTQVKLRGYRIELEEIESVLVSHPAVAGATVILRDDAPGGKRLVGYVMPRDGDGPAVSDLREHLGRYLPPYMIPSAFVVMSALPLTATGKVNRAALPAPEAAGTGEQRLHVAPRTPAEELVAGVFGDILSVERVGAEDNFFELGGNSLQGARVVARLAEASGVTVSLREFYTSPTVASMAALLDPAAAVAADGAGEEWTPLVGIKPNGSRTPFYAPHAVSGSPFSYMGMARLLDPDQPMFGFEAPGLEGDRPVAQSVDELATIYLEALRRARPGGPYHLGGWSMGGFVAYEMARRLLEEGEEVGLLALIDSDAPGPSDPPDEVECMRLFIGDLSGIMGRPAPELDPSVEGLGAEERMVVLLRTLRQADLMPQDIDERWLVNRFAVFRANARAMYTYQPRPYAGTVTMIRAEESAAVRDTTAGWARWAERVEDHLVPGNHYTIWGEPNVARVAETLQACLDRVNAGATG